MTEYVIDIELLRVPQYYGGTNHRNYFIKIDTNGNVNIRYQNGSRDFTSNLWPLVIINDNIPIPSHNINMIKCLLKETDPGGDRFNMAHFDIIIESIKILKQDISKSSTQLIDLING